MRKIVVLMHTSLDGFVAGPNGEMDWIRFDDELWENVTKVTDGADTALYGRITFQMMEGYWPTAAESPNASKHDIEHANWTNNNLKIVFSRSLAKTEWKNTRFIKDNIADEMKKLKEQSGKNLLLIGSASIVHTFMELDLIDEYWININPVLLGAGTPLFKNIKAATSLKLAEAKKFNCGVLGVQYTVERS
jgi:dihydrofolate reductase